MQREEQSFYSAGPGERAAFFGKTLYLDVSDSTSGEKQTNLQLTFKLDVHTRFDVSSLCLRSTVVYLPVITARWFVLRPLTEMIALDLFVSF